MTEHDTDVPRSKPDEFPGSTRSAGSRDAEGSAGRDECEFASRVSAYHDGELTEVEAGELARHLSACQACAAQLAFFGRVSSTFEDAPVRHLGSDARQRLESLGDQLGAESTPQVDRLRIRPSADVKWVRRLTVAAAILFVVAAGKVIYEQKFAGHGAGTGTPAVDPRAPVAPVPEPVSVHGQGPRSEVPGGIGPAVTNAEYVGQAAPKSPATGPTEKP